jgi:hypothetical protein
MLFGTVQVSHQVCQFFFLVSSIECLEMMPLWCWQVNWGKLWDSLWNTQLSVWKTGKDSSEACTFVCQNCAVYSVFLSGIIDIYIFLTATGFTPSSSSKVHIYTQKNTQNTENGTYIAIKKLITTSHIKIAQFNWGCTGCLSDSLQVSLPTMCMHSSKLSPT